MSCSGQYQDNSPDLLKKLGVKSLLVTTDSLQDGCPVDYFEYDPYGRIIYHQLGPTEDRRVFSYSKTNLIYSVEYFEADDGTKTILDTTFYYYNLDNSLKYSIQKSPADSENPAKTDTIKADTTLKTPSTRTLKNPSYNKAKQLISHTVNGIHKACLTPSKGDHVLKYYYNKNGLIKKVDIFTSANKKYMTWFFIYNDKTCCRK